MLPHVKAYSFRQQRLFVTVIKMLVLNWLTGMKHIWRELRMDKLTKKA